MASIAENLRQVREQIDSSIAQSGRAAGCVKLLAVSKTKGAEQVLEAWQAGQQDFGENYVQEALEKMSAVAAMLPSASLPVWHFIGPVQSNKTRDIAANFQWVHSIERVRIAQRLSSQRPDGLPPLNVCVQVNLSGEDSKSGLALEQAEGLCAQISELPRLELRGLMAIPAPCSDHEQQRLVYRPLAQLFNQLSARYPHFDTLSIGMSEDYRAAIAEGSSMVRIGTAIFGKRG
ncbi:MAG: YggS family pyridoxal phosphate-dependent enzyme [Pseudomonadales bacterium]|nr:YggS family pyridoxal phosphate-dependent enzyme [Pseudomonadales bacterium]